MADTAEFDDGWRTARASTANGNCVQLRRSDGHVLVRNSRQPNGPSLRFTPAELAAFLDGARAGEFDDLCEDPE